MKFSAIALMMRMTGILSGGREVRWLQVPPQKQKSYADILGLKGFEDRPLRIASTAVREDTHAGGASGVRHASARSAQ